MSDTDTPVGAGTATLSPEEQAAEEAMARAAVPPPSMGGPEPEPAVIGEVGEGGEFPSRVPRLERLAREPRPDLEVEGDETLEARNAAAAGRADEDDWAAVTEWLLSDTTDVITRKLKVRVGGGDDDPVVLPWIIRAIGIDTIRSAEREASGANRSARRGGAGQYDELKANLRIVVEGTVKPDLKAAAGAKGLADATILVQRQLAYRPGVIAQIAGEIMSLSGFDAEDVRAAGN